MPVPGDDDSDGDGDEDGSMLVPLNLEEKEEVGKASSGREQSLQDWIRKLEYIIRDYRQKSSWTTNNTSSVFQAIYELTSFCFEKKMFSRL